jgi:predicted small secreted protein
MIRQLIKHLTSHRRALAGLLILALLGLLTWANPAAPLSRAADTLADAWRRLGQAAAPPAYAVSEGRPLGQGSGSGGGGGPAVIKTVVQSGNTLYVGGSFTTIGGQSRNNLAALDAATGSILPWNPNANSTVYTLAISGSTVYAGGEFTSIGGQSRNYIAVLDAASGSVLPWNPNAWHPVFAPKVHTLAISGSAVYAGGQFTSIGGQSRNNLAALDAASGSILPWNPNANDTVHTLAISGSAVYVGGSFTTIGGQSRNRIAALDATTGNATPWNPPNVSGGSTVTRVNTLAVGGSTVYVGGYFTTIGGQSRNYIAALDAATGSLTPWNPNANGNVYTLAINGDAVYVGGYFTTIGGQSRNNLAALDAASGSATAWDPNANGPVLTLAISGSTLYAGGAFTAIGDPGGLRWQIVPGLAAFDISTPIYLPLIFKN